MSTTTSAVVEGSRPAAKQCSAPRRAATVSRIPSGRLSTFGLTSGSAIIASMVGMGAPAGMGSASTASMATVAPALSKLPMTTPLPPVVGRVDPDDKFGKS